MDADHASRDELRAYAKEHKIAGYSKLRAPELREVVRAHLAENVTRVDGDSPGHYGEGEVGPLSSPAADGSLDTASSTPPRASHEDDVEPVQFGIDLGRDDPAVAVLHEGERVISLNDFIEHGAHRGPSGQTHAGSGIDCGECEAERSPEFTSDTDWSLHSPLDDDSHADALDDYDDQEAADADDRLAAIAAQSVRIDETPTTVKPDLSRVVDALAFAGEAARRLAAALQVPREFIDGEPSDPDQPILYPTGPLGTYCNYGPWAPS